MIYFVRHGCTDWNEHKNEKGEKDPKCQGLVDIPLNETGIMQALQTQKALADIKFDLVLTSPLLRARQTLDIIYNGTTEKVIDNRLIERDFGELEGLTRKQFDFVKFWTVGENYPKKAESLESVIKRAYRLLNELGSYQEKNVLLVSHGGIGCVIKSFFYEPPIKNYLLSLEMPHGKHTIYNPSKLSTERFPKSIFN